MGDSAFVPVKVRGLALDPDSRLPILLLQDHGGRVLLPIWIGAFEAGAIATRLEGRDFPRPMTHDLLKNVIEALGAEVTRVDIRALQEGTFFADLYVRRADGHELRLDCRPSDAVALAVRVGAPLRAAAQVLEAAQPMPAEEAGEGKQAPAPVSADDEEARQRLLDQLAEMDPEDFGDYEM